MAAQKAQIFSLKDNGNRPASINNDGKPLENISLDYPIRTWTLTEVGFNVYEISTDNYPTTVTLSDNVAASQYTTRNVLWYFHYRPEKNAYTIELVQDRSKVWTVVDGPPPNLPIQTKTVKAKIPPEQLWRVVFLD